LTPGGGSLTPRWTRTPRPQPEGSTGSVVREIPASVKILRRPLRDGQFTEVRP